MSGRLLQRLKGLTALRPRRREMPDVVRLLMHRPAFLFGVSAFETAVLFSNRVDPKVKLEVHVDTDEGNACDLTHATKVELFK